MQNVFIINFKLLYEILDEIKENLSFKIIKFDEEKNFEKDQNLDIKNSVIISKTNHKLLHSNKDINKNFLEFKNLPITLNKLIEIINIKLIKLKFNYQSDIIIKDYKLNLNSKFFSKGNLNLKLTEKEIEIILYLNNIKTKSNVLNLQKEIWSYSENIETHTVETHIYRLRKKIANLFKDENFILSHKDGYFIN
ncbi:winged helix-turn-helix domain-containing protein [Candidatus Pelagibacter sp.]|nr:winged helix-turn-helix domain-containing protein [Candidatus Pelagibacter sp.]